MIGDTAPRVLAALARRWDQLPDRPTGEWTESALEEATDAIVWLAGWLEDHPLCRDETYRTEVSRVKSGGVLWNRVRETPRPPMPI